ncbi:hypothetical protein TL5118_03858 [Thalassovita autumnalis]|uniref:Uncharacterized protein n=1 Tax=Thalassovita autumnalis TaxID=2072972 RepID=A0A0P1FWG9_9RHOB|nr:hypothetical protein TL5118_03858 [Thalassovita autumnalis]CUH73275.1 hypothetical protein TL5120_03082 [Thalassovita autumnalis]
MKYRNACCATSKPRACWRCRGTQTAIGHSDCLTDQGTGPCEAGIKKMQKKLDHIDRLQSDLSKRRATILLLIKDMQAGLADAKAPTPEMVD